MYSFLPAFVSALFFAYGVHVLGTQGRSRLALSFFAVCVFSFFWQGTWAVLFQVSDPDAAQALVRLGYLFILFLPTSLYHFLTELAERPAERPWVAVSYGAAAMLACVLLASDLFIAGHYRYFWGYYPKAGPLHPLHIAQTALVVMRGLYLVYRQLGSARGARRVRLRLCAAAVLTYFAAAVDYACNYGVEFYPPGVVFVAISLGLITVAIQRYGLMGPTAVAASLAGELRTPLAAIRVQAHGVDLHLPALLEGYRQAVAHGLVADSIDTKTLRGLSASAGLIGREAERSSQALNMLLAAVAGERLDTREFGSHAVHALVEDALERYSYQGGERESVHFAGGPDFRFVGSDALFALVLFNLLKNGLYALRAAGKGVIEISTEAGPGVNLLHFTDTGTGIRRETQALIFNPFFTTKPGCGSGLGLPFCQRVMHAFGGAIRCSSEAGMYTTFTLVFPAVSTDAGNAAPARRWRSRPELAPGG